MESSAEKPQYSLTGEKVERYRNGLDQWWPTRGPYVARQNHLTKLSQFSSSSIKLITHLFLPNIGLANKLVLFQIARMNSPYMSALTFQKFDCAVCLFAEDVGLPELIYGTEKEEKTPRRNRFTTERYSVFAEEARQFAVSRKKVLIGEKKESVDPLYPHDERHNSCCQRNKEMETNLLRRKKSACTLLSNIEFLSAMGHDRVTQKRPVAHMRAADRVSLA
ncbi:hypothetical protein TNCV_243141 [Trichonephila clavipes]|uniref:Uncharacterized protein n=1 Tax=Trichonephila clavipes TaxID=2585209 RepID=A0A8X6W482_TRICX|nr:hypothetical protein TNCV_243141 [Trichonephila clavipes]